MPDNGVIGHGRIRLWTGRIYLEDRVTFAFCKARFLPHPYDVPDPDLVIVVSIIDVDVRADPVQNVVRRSPVPVTYLNSA